MLTRARARQADRADGRLSLVVALVLLTAAACSFRLTLPRIGEGGLGQRWISASEDASRQGCTANRPTR